MVACGSRPGRCVRRGGDNCAVTLPWWLGYALAGLIVLAIALAAWARAVAASRRARRRARRALAGERAAERLLAGRGFRVVDRQVPLCWDIAVAGEPCSVDLRVDFLAERHGRLYVAEVKTGNVAPDIGNAATRRQLLEYLIAYRADAALLVDAELGDVLEVDFDAGDLPGRSRDSG